MTQQIELDKLSRFEIDFDDGKFDTEYSDYIMANCGGDRLICNGDMLIDAIEDGYLYDDFRDYMTGETK